MAVGVSGSPEKTLPREEPLLPLKGYAASLDPDPAPNTLSTLRGRMDTRWLLSARRGGADPSPSWSVHSGRLAGSGGAEGTCLASVSTMYRILREHQGVHERRRRATHPARVVVHSVDLVVRLWRPDRRRKLRGVGRPRPRRRLVWGIARLLGGEMTPCAGSHGNGG